MVESLSMAFETKYPGKYLLTIEEVATAIDCPKRLVYNWMRRPDPKMRPPIYKSGKWIRIPVKDFIVWLSKSQSQPGGFYG